MKIVFVSNFMNIHQQPLCEALYDRLGENFAFIETTPIDADRVEMGFDSNSFPFVKSILTSDGDRKECLELIRESDVAIMGSAPDDLLRIRLNSKKLTFKYSERFFKGANSLSERVRFFFSSFRHIRPLKKENMYFLCASAYTAQDINRYEDFSGRSYKWGYFREVVPVIPDQIISQKVKNSILWVGRMIDWKHPELAILLAEQLRQNNIEFDLNMIGNGEMLPEIEKMIKERNLQDSVHLLGAKKPDEVRHYMNRSEIFIGTSDFKEGWGVVVNEAMNSCCVVIASHAMGSVPFLIKNGENGLIFESDNLHSLTKKVLSVITDRTQLVKIQRNAFYVLESEWNAEVAADRLLKMVEELMAKKSVTEYSFGPCSQADILPNDWYQEK